MTIKRSVNGVEMCFELTDLELMNAYYEWQNEVDKEDVQSMLDEMEQSVNDEQLDLIADAFRDMLSEDDSWRSHARNAIEQFLKRRENHE